MKKLILLIFLLSLSSVYAETDLSYQTFNVKLDAGVALDFQSSKSRINYFKADLSFFPKNYYNQEVLSLDFKSEPRANIKEGDNIEFKWDAPNKENLSYGFDSKIKVKTAIPRVDKEIKFPSDFILEENIKYTKATEYIDTNGDIKKKAEEITRNSDDLYEAVFNLADWIRQNVEYDLSSLTENVVQKSSWVLENKKGVCDEITSLFISFLRSLKIPARYVIGLAYTDAVEEGWAPHAWAEVYFEGYGWIPFDITFGQYGWVDSGHVKLAETFDSKEANVEYNWKSVKVGLKDKKFELESEILEKGEKIIPFVDLELEILKDKIGSGSFVPVEVLVKNLQPYYLTTLVYVTSAPAVIGDNTQAVLLKPKEEKKIYWLLKINEELNSNFKYKYDVSVGNNFGGSAESELEAASVYPAVSEEEAQFMIKRREQGLEPILVEEEIVEEKEEKRSLFEIILGWFSSS